ncbi:rRNA maturation RNAse YbeY, partial [Neisseria sicca]|uniref:rRNA maturation RNAse YbeY n=1 Tax=Neisseria sicca TaxID=490 RepID=UPI001649D240
EAAEQGKPAEQHFADLTMHATLHVMGYEHMEEGEGEEMEGVEMGVVEGDLKGVEGEVGVRVGVMKGEYGGWMGMETSMNRGVGKVGGVLRGGKIEIGV